MGVTLPYAFGWQPGGRIDGPGDSNGGASVNNAGRVTVSHSTFHADQGCGGISDGGGVSATNTLVGYARGGGSFGGQGSFIIAESTFTGNRAVGGNGGNEGSGATT